VKGEGERIGPYEEEGRTGKASKKYSPICVRGNHVNPFLVVIFVQEFVFKSAEFECLDLCVVGTLSMNMFLVKKKRMNERRGRAAALLVCYSRWTGSVEPTRS
jgi:hypothetical protein